MELVKPLTENSEVFVMIIRRFFTALFAFASGWIMIPSMLAGSLIGTAFAVILMGMSFYISPKSYKIRNEQT